MYLVSSSFGWLMVVMGSTTERQTTERLTTERLTLMRLND